MDVLIEILNTDEDINLLMEDNKNEQVLWKHQQQ